MFDAPLDPDLFSLVPPSDYYDGVSDYLAPKPINGKKTEFVFADVQNEVAKTTSLQYTEQSAQKMPDGSSSPIRHIKILGGSDKREEMETDRPNSMFLGPFGPTIEITDLDKKKKATLYPQIKGYQLMDWGGTFANAYVPATPEAQKKLDEQVAAARREQENRLPKEIRDKVTAVAVAGPMDWGASKPLTQLDIYELIKNVPTDHAKRQGEKIINGRPNDRIRDRAAR